MSRPWIYTTLTLRTHTVSARRRSPWRCYLRRNHDWKIFRINKTKRYKRIDEVLDPLTKENVTGWDAVCVHCGAEANDYEVGAR